MVRIKHIFSEVDNRLSAFYYWRDRQSLQQALWVAKSHPHDIEDIKRWSSREAMDEKFAEFESLLNEHF